MLQILTLSLLVSGAAVVASGLIGIPLGIWLGLNRFWGKGVVTALVHTGRGPALLPRTEGSRQLAHSLQETKLPQGVMLNSCASGEVSFEERAFGHGAFMHFVLEGLRGAADRGSDNAVSLNELQRYASTRTKAYVIDKFNSTQRPFFRGEGEHEVMDFALIPLKEGSPRPKLDPKPKVILQPKSDPVTKSLPSTSFIGNWKSDRFGTCARPDALGQWRRRPDGLSQCQSGSLGGHYFPANHSL